MFKKSYIVLPSCLIVSLLFSHNAIAFDASPAERKANIVKPTKLLAKPQFNSPIVTELLKDELVSINYRDKAWYRVISTQEQSFTGWVNMLAVRFSGKAKRDGELGVGSLFNSATSRTLPTVSTGVRGFDEKELKKSKADFNQLDIVKSYQISAEQAADFAEQGKLTTRQISLKKEKK